MVPAIIATMSPGSRRSAGERIGPFEIERYLASGGMGDVYVGRVVDTGEAVALKFELGRADYLGQPAWVHAAMQVAFRF